MLFFMRAQHIIGHFEGFLLCSRQFRGLKNSWTTRKQQQCLTIYVLPANIKIMSKTFRISSKTVFYAWAAIKKPKKNHTKNPKKPPKNPLQRGFF
jgi:hypothetical protein